MPLGLESKCEVCEFVGVFSPFVFFPRAVIPSEDQFCISGNIGNVKTHFCLWELWAVCYDTLWVEGRKLLNLVQCTGRPAQQQVNTSPGVAAPGRRA